MVRSLQHASLNIFAILLVLNSTLATLVHADPATSARQKQMADEANDIMFKTAPDDLYTENSPGNFDFNGEAITTDDLFPGTVVEDHVSNPLPTISEQSDLYGHRDNQLGDLEFGIGKFTSTGSLNAEAVAVDILKGAAGVPSQRQKTFLDPSRTLLGDTTALREDFADCTIEYNSTPTTVNLTNTTTETCEYLPVDLTPMNGERSYLGPNDPAVVSYSGGNIFCTKGSVTIRIESASLCPFLNIMTEIPSEVVYLSSCTTGVTGCLEFTLEQNAHPYPNGRMPWLFDGFTSWSQFCSNIGVVTSSGYRSGCGHWGAYSSEYSTVRWNLSNGPDVRLTEVDHLRNGRSFVKPPSVTSEFGVLQGDIHLEAEASGPPSTPGGRPYENKVSEKRGLIYTYYQRRGDEGDEYITVRGDVPYINDGYMYVAWRSKRGGFVVNKNEFFAAIHYHRIESWSLGSDHVTLKFRPGFDILSSQARLTGTQSRLMHNGLDVGVTTSWTPIPAVAADGVTEHDFALQEVVSGSKAKASVQIYFDNATFSSWLVNSSRYAEMLKIKDIPGCTYDIDVHETADPSSTGCVAANLGVNGATNSLICGANIPTGELSDIPDRAATKVTYTPRCDVPLADGTVYPSINNCGPLEARAECAAADETCLGTTVNGDCFMYSRNYECSSPSSYTSVISTRSTVCEGFSCMGEDCVFNSSADGSVDLAETAAKLASLEMMLSDMDCGGFVPTPTMSDATVSAGMLECRLFNGDYRTCGKIALGLQDCCNEAKGVSMTDYLLLGFAASRLNASLGELGVTTPITPAWTSFKDMTRDSYQKLTQPITQTFESIIGNTGISGNAATTFSLQAVKQQAMRSMAQFTLDAFGKNAASALFENSLGPLVNSSGVLRAGGEVAFSSGVSTVMSAVATAYTVYMIGVIAIEILFACSDDEIELGVQKALKSTHYIGSFCSKSVFGACLKKKEAYCSYSSPLARIMNEEIKDELGTDFGTPQNGECDGFTLRDLQSVDMDNVDLSEWTGIMVNSGVLDMSRVTDIEKLTGKTSTLGQSLEDLYDREDALERNVKRVDGVNFDDLRQDAIDDR